MGTSDHDHARDEAHTLYRTAAGSAFFSSAPPVAAGRLRPGERDLVEMLAEHLRAADELERHAAAFVDELRGCGVSWDVIGWAAGITAEGARQRWLVRRQDQAG